MNTTGGRIRSLRKKHGLTQKRLGDLIGVSSVSVTQWESDTQLPKGDNADKLCTALNTNWQWLRHEAGEQVGGAAKSGFFNITKYYENPTMSEIPFYLAGKAKVSEIKSVVAINEYEGNAIFVTMMEGDSMAPMLNNKDRLYINRDLPPKQLIPAMYMINEMVVIGLPENTPQGMMLRFLSTEPGWEPVNVTQHTYIGSLFAIDPLWAYQDR